MPDGKKILLALKDRKVSEELARFLKEKGLEIASVEDGARALESVLKEPPSFIVIDPYLPIIKGERLFQILKNNPHTSRVPFMFISEAQKDVKGFRIGMDIFVTRPFHWDEIYGKIKHTLASGGRMDASLGDKDLQGRLSHIHLADVIQMLHMNKKEGELSVSSPAGTGSVSMKNGEIFNAVCGRAEREKALFRLLTWKDGTFAFRPAAVESTRKITLTTGNLLMEAMRQMDEYENSKHLFPAPETVLTTNIEVASLPGGLKPVMHEVFNLVKHHPVVRDLVDRSSFPDYEVYRTLASLLTRRLVEEVKGEKREGGREFVPPAQAIKIKEKLISRWSDMLAVNFGKLLIASTAAALTRRFVEASAALPDFFPRLMDEDTAALGRPTGKEARMGEDCLGDLGVLKLYGGMEVVFFSVPTVGGMSPLIKTLSGNVIGLVLLWDSSSEAGIPGLISTRNDVLSRRRVPVMHIHAGDTEPDKAIVKKYRTMLNLKQDDPVFTLTVPRKDNMQGIFQSFFMALLKEDYITGKVYAV
ncbi:MAG: DUF4388 domain-containing protein [Deltaproteobacteria bacterium]|nr:DUF4388 domain-containing protein [Deltaproteobacteria bacterium]